MVCEGLLMFLETGLVVGILGVRGIFMNYHMFLMPVLQSKIIGMNEILLEYPYRITSPTLAGVCHTLGGPTPAFRSRIDGRIQVYLYPTQR